MLLASALSVAAFLAGPATAQFAALPVQPEPPGPVKIPDAPQLPYHFGARPVAPLGEKFGNVAAITLMKNGDLLVYNRNPDIMMVEYDPSGTTVKRVFIDICNCQGYISIPAGCCRQVRPLTRLGT